MVQIDSIIDQNPTPNLVSELVELGIRNKMCFAELKMFSNYGKYIGKHPFFTLDTNRRKLYEQLNHNLKDFLEQYRSASNNIVRYKSMLAKEKDEEKKQKHLDAIKKHEENTHLIIQILNEHLGGIQNTITEDI